MDDRIRNVFELARELAAEVREIHNEAGTEYRKHKGRKTHSDSDWELKKREESMQFVVYEADSLVGALSRTLKNLPKISREIK